MRVTKIHLFNFRSVEDLTLDTTADGMHLVYGSFGAGKSSFLTGMRFALFGDNGEAGTNLDLRRRGASNKDDAGCEVTFTHGQDTYVARRWLRRSERKNGPVEKAQASLTVNGKKMDGITPSKLTGQMEEVLGMSAKAFTSAAMIPQGEVATLMKAAPAEVQALIEQHTGLDGLTKARDEARKTAREAATKAEALPGDPERIADLEEQLNDAHRDVQEKQTAEKAAADRADAANDLSDKADAALTTLRNAETAAQQWKQQVAAARQRNSSSTQHAHDVAEEARAAGINLDESEDADRNALQRVDSKMEAISQAGGDLSNRTRAVSETEEATRRADSELVAAQEAAASAAIQARSLDETEKRLGEEETRITNQWQESREIYSQSEANYNRLEKAITTLSGNGTDKHHCPTCQQEVENFEQLVNELRTAQQRDSDSMDKARKTGVECRNELEKIKGEKDTLATKRSNLEKTRNAVDAAQRDLDRVHEAETAQRQQVATAEEALRNLLHDNDTTPGNDLLQSGRDLYKRLKTERDRLVSAAQIRRRHTKAIAEADRAATELSELEAQNLHAPQQEEIDAASTKATTLREEARQANTAYRQASQELASTKTGEAMLQHQLDEATAEWNRKTAAVAEATTARGEADVLAALRSDLLAEYTASICRSASDMLAGFGGEYVAFHLDDDFIPRAELADGTLVRTSILSGGEAALVGLSFRIGVTLHITGGGLPEQIIGDEVTNYLDEAGRRSVLSLLNKIFPSVILVSHTDESQDYATEVHGVVRPELGATRWADTPHPDSPQEEQEAA